ncbi:MAG: amidohydrolase family protein [Chloroflexi bacterium]|nr:amidohydrolase family protein [Chloroflexota bacterium]
MKRSLLFTALILAFIGGTIALAQSGDLALTWWTIGGGGGTSNGNEYTLSSTIGQAGAGRLIKGVYDLSGGYWTEANTTSDSTATIYLPLITNSSPFASTIFYNGTVLTLEAQPAQAQAIAIQGDKIMAVGTNTDILALQGSSTEMIDLGGKTLLPGFVEGHTHVLWSPEGISLDEAIATPLQYGFTTITELSGDEGHLNQLMAAEAEGRLRLRVNVFPMYNASYLDENGQTIIQNSWYPAHAPILENGRFLRIPGIKIYVDGAFEAPRGCPALTAPYPLAVQAEPYFWDICFDERGDLYLDQQALTQAVVAIQAAGYRTAFHAMGDKAIEVALNAIERALKGQSNEQVRHQIHHNSFLRPDQVQRFSDLHILGSVRGYFNTCDQADYEFYVGADRYAWAANRFALPGTNAHAFAEGDFQWGTAPEEITSSTTINPFLTLYGLVTRRQLRADGTPCEPAPWLAQHQISVEQALRMLTIEPAYAVSQEDVIGSLAPGKFADIIILSDNPLTVNPNTLKDLEVLMTMVGGNAEYCTPGWDSFCANNE